ncbi:hypothetical protein FGG78_19000 [Thioclava sp. BHET1]|nr:hypothetical protein FGG78_19000 [Thioclava sp. BHET1]
MANKKKTTKSKAESPQAIRPIRPFLLGFGIAAAWGAVHLPTVLQPVAAGDFAAELIAIAIVSGGLLAALVELLIVALNRAGALRMLLTRRP